MTSIDRDIVQAKALLVDPNPTSRSIMAAQLREIGVGSVTQCGRLLDARRTLEYRTFDIVLCESHFPGESMTGQQLLDDLRRAQLLPFSTVFVMITAEVAYDEITEAAESALDCSLLKPHTAATLPEAAMAHKFAGDVGATVRELLAHTERTRNPKLLEMAAMKLKRYRDAVSDTDALQCRLEALRPRAGSVPSAPRLAAERVRQAGGIALRTPSPATAAPA